MSENFELDGGVKAADKAFPIKFWQMVTNQSNLFYMIAAGMIMPPEGFGKKYYQDTVSAFPGYLPIFPKSVSQAAVEYSISEKSHLYPCIINLDLSNLSGPVKIITEQGEVKNVNFPEEVNNSCQLMLVPAPLPMNCVSSIVFRSREDKLRGERDASDFSNVNLSSYTIKTAAGVFTKLKTQIWPLKKITVGPFKAVLDVPMAAGAMMGLLLNMNTYNSLSILAGKLAFDPNIPLSELASYPVIMAMGEWLQKGGAIESDDVSQKLYWNIVSKIAMSKYSTEPSSSIDVAINYLETMPSEEFDEKTRSYGKKLAVDLREILGLADSTISEIFERHPKPVSRAMTLFVLREKIDDLLEFKNPLLTEADYILAAILFSAREGWIGLSKGLREFPGLSVAVSHRMAVISHSIADTKLDFGPPPPRPESLLELLFSEGGLMTKLQKEAALYLARELKWECIQTRINLGKGEYQLDVTAAGIQLTLDGDVKAVITEVLVREFREKLCSTEISAKVDRKVREILGVVK